MSNFIIINNKLCKEKDAKISVLDHAVLLGDGVFEALRVLNGRLLDFDEHYARLKKSAKQILLKVPASKEDLKKQTKILIKANNFKNAKIRITITRGIGPGISVNCSKQSVIIFGNELEKTNYHKGVKVATFNIEISMPAVKSLNFLPSIMAKNYAHQKKAFEAILIDYKGYAREGATSNLFIVKSNMLLTPEKDILQGITRDIVIKLAKIKIQETEISKKELLNADEVFITSSIIGITPVIKVDNIKKKIGNITKNLIKLYEKNRLQK